MNDDFEKTIWFISNDSATERESIRKLGVDEFLIKLELYFNKLKKE